MEKQFLEMKKQIDRSDVISFDVFDTLIKRIVNNPETVFDLTGKQFGIMNLSELRQKYQMLASQKAERECKLPHADFDDIYEYIKKHDKNGYDWDSIKNTEIQLEEDCLVCNKEMFDIFQYAKQAGKRIIITSDMYLKKSWIEKILRKCGYQGYSNVYVSSDVHATKYNGDIFEFVCRSEKVSPDRIVHIGDNYISDVENAKKYGFNAIQYKPVHLKKEQIGRNPSSIDIGTAECVLDRNGSFWYNLGAFIGGPLYLGLCQWMRKKISEIGYKNIYFLARDGYNLYQIFKDNEAYNSQYLYMSRRALLLAGIDCLDEDTLAILPPFTLGQTVREVLNYLGVEEVCGNFIQSVGISSLDYVIKNTEDIEKVKKIYTANEKGFLEKCAEERENAKRYFESIGFFDDDSIVFDCGWNGSSQYLLDRFLKCIGYDKQNYFLYVGIMDTIKSRKQLHNKRYSTYLFNYDSNRLVQNKVKDSIVLFELFFGAPEESVYMYDDSGIVLENTGIDNGYKSELCQGISAFVRLAESVVEKYNISITEQNAISGLLRLVDHPTQEEAKTIGNLENVDGFAVQNGLTKYIAKLDSKTYTEYPNIEIYWLQGLLTRDDIETKLKKKVAKDKGLTYDVESKKRVKKQKNIVASAIEKDAYSEWIEENEKDSKKIVPLEYNPLFTFVVPVYNVIDEQLIACIESIREQTYSNWELWLIDDASQWKSVRKILAKYEKENNINVHYRKENGHISKATNDGIERAKGEFIAFMDCDDVIAPNALYEFAKKINENRELDFIYSDEDKLSEDGRRRHSPFFKPDWSPDTFMSLMYTNHLAVYRAELVKKVGGLRTEFNGAQDYDFTLRFMELSDNKKVGHIPKVLYYWRERGESIASNPEAKPYALDAVKRAKEEALARRGWKGYVEYVSDMFQYRVVYENKDNDKVSIIIPSKDNVSLLEQCINSIKKYTKYQNYEIIIVDNGSSDENKKLINQIAAENNIVYHYEKMDFNFSKMCNIGANLATGKYSLFLNDDIEIFYDEWLGRLVGHASLPYVGAVGAKLLYPESNTIQHVGITNLMIGPSHSLIGFNDTPVYYFGRNRMDYNFLAVTAACLVVSKDKFEQVGGFDETLTVAYNDVDLCFKLYEAGYYNVVRNDVSMYHYESASRGSDDVDEEKKKRLLDERKRLYEKHPKLNGVDPFYNLNLVPNRVDYAINAEQNSSMCNKKLGRLYLKKTYETEYTVFIDSIEMSNNIYISGWFFWDKDYVSNHCKVELVLKDKHNRCIYFDTDKKTRVDVAKALNNNACYTGFGSRIAYNELFLNETDYCIGVLITTPVFHRKKLCWTNKMLSCVADDYYMCFSDLKSYTVNDIVYDRNMFDYEIESYDRITGVLKGWAIKTNSLNNDFVDYQIVYILGNECYAVQVRRGVRIDIARRYPSMTNTLRCGFEAIIPENHRDEIDIQKIYIGEISDNW